MNLPGIKSICVQLVAGVQGLISDAVTASQITRKREHFHGIPDYLLPGWLQRESLGQNPAAVVSDVWEPCYTGLFVFLFFLIY